MELWTPSYTTCEIKYQTYIEKAFILGALCLSGFDDYSDDEDLDVVLVNVPCEDIADFQIFYDDLEEQWQSNQRFLEE